MKKDKNKAAQAPERPETVEAEVVEEAAAETGEATPEQWQAALELAVQQRDDAAKDRDKYLEAYQRSQADFQNFKRRNQTARSDGYTDGVCDVLEALLPALDNMDRALASAPEGDPLAKGVQMTLDAMLRSMEKFGLTEVAAEGEDFDPEKHNAVVMEEGDTPGKILEVFQKGWMVKDKIIRHPMVKVCK